MNNRAIADILNQLLAAETESYTERLLESGNYVSWNVAGHFAELRRMATEEREHERWLTEAILRLREAPRPVSPGIDTAASHYLDYTFLFPLVIDDKKRLIQSYKAALSRVPSNSWVANLLMRIAARQEEHLNILTSSYAAAKSAETAAAPAQEKPAATADKPAQAAPAASPAK